MDTFLRDLASRPFRHGETDCALVLADWLIACGRNQDPAEHLRGIYATETECAAVLKASGGLLRLVARLAKGSLLERVAAEDAPPGSIAVLRFGDPQRHYGALRAPSGRWAVKCTNGLLLLRNPRVIAAWKV
jgi:hypothetical protein